LPRGNEMYAKIIFTGDEHEANCFMGNCLMFLSVVYNAVN